MQLTKQTFNKMQRTITRQHLEIRSLKLQNALQEKQIHDHIRERRMFVRCQVVPGFTGEWCQSTICINPWEIKYYKWDGFVEWLVRKQVKLIVDMIQQKEKDGKLKDFGRETSHAAVLPGWR